MIDKCRLCSTDLIHDGFFCNDKPDVEVGHCLKCKAVQLFENAENIEEIYKSINNLPEDFEVERKRQENWNRKRIELVRRYIPGAGKLNLLDFGSGTGGFLEKAQKNFKSVVGYDISPEVCGLHDRSGWRCVSDLRSIDAKSIGIITLFHVLEHLPRPWEILKDIKGKFKNIEYFVIEVPNTDEALLSVFNMQKYRNNHYSSQHIWYFTEKSLGAVLKKAGLTVVVSTQLQRYSLLNNVGWMIDHRVEPGEYDFIFGDRKMDGIYEKALIKNRIADSIFVVCRRGKREK
ncbi:MAG TPA: hypothetical protein DET40_17550 [Lentisphaeria bacterium]|nr:MAG: hypothetical protein A2X45_02455 [Lentisphaerae bacterium GWF2_50_93]HCE45348.1 hypothetical protein [Lentisphaeria bacterium]